eukprot:TRINITY_DN38054_c0_g1_i1.p1 TRINITY_DN38054_c0_g1~~TRINITY_DN38054_c0_g1_i1.p1  ORF type:complete len:571 (+),score=119.01 TRINITY_DN38054_c0_g1_i1:144-1715(+)
MGGGASSRAAYKVEADKSPAGADAAAGAVRKPPPAKDVPPPHRDTWAMPRNPEVSKPFSSEIGLVIAADVGGTNSRFMLYKVDLKEPILMRQEAPGELLIVKKYANIMFAEFSLVFGQFLEDARDAGALKEGQVPDVACFAVAGVAQHNRSRLTNLDWLIDGPQLSKDFDIKVIEVINDFVAQGYGVLTLGDDEVVQLAGPSPVPLAPIACVGAGTGLGQCFLTSGPTGEYQAFPSEGGHAEFAPRGAGNDETQIELLRYLKVKFSGWNRISFERVVSGKGICNVYEFMAYRNPGEINREVHKAFLASPGDAGIIAKNAATDPLCKQTLKIFADCYGTVCGTFALQVMPFGGIYISGGVTQKLQKFLSDDTTFLDAYFDKGRVSPFLKDIPLFFVKGDEMGQRGAHLRSVRLLHHHRAGIQIVYEPKERVANLVPPRSAGIAQFLKQAEATLEADEEEEDDATEDPNFARQLSPDTVTPMQRRGTRKGTYQSPRPAEAERRKTKEIDVVRKKSFADMVGEKAA